MAGLTLSDIREALADQIRDGITRQVTVYPYKPPTMTYPAICLVAAPGDYVTYDLSFGTTGIATVDLIIEIHIAAFKLDEQRALDDYLSAGSDNGSSVVDAVRSDRTLGGIVELCDIKAASGPTLNPADFEPLAARIPVKIYCLKEL